MKMSTKSMLTAVLVFLAGSMALAQETAHAAGTSDWKALGALGAFLGLGLAALGGTLGQSKVAAATMEGIARNPQAQGQMFVPFVLSLALIESLVITAFVIAFLVLGKLS